MQTDSPVPGGSHGGGPDAPVWEDLVALLDHLPAMVAFWDTGQRNRFANHAYVEWFGKAPAELRGMHIADLLGPKVYGMNLPYIQGALSGRTQLFERVLVDMSGHARHVQATYTPHVVDGTVRGFFVVVVDISTRVEAERALLASTEQVVLQRERERVAMRLNELVFGHLSEAALKLSSALQPGAHDTAKRIRAALQSIDDAVRDLRSSAFALDPSRPQGAEDPPSQPQRL